MQLLKRFLSRIGDSLGGLFGFGTDVPDSRISPAKALEYTPVWHAVNKISGHFAQLPINCHRRLDRGSKIDREHPGHILVHVRPNGYQTAQEWKMQCAKDLLLYGNWRNAIIRAGSKPDELLPMRADRSVSCWIDGERWHGTVVCKHEPLAVAFGLKEDSQTLWLSDENVLFVHGLSMNGIDGIDPTALMANTVDAGLSAENQVRTLAKKGFSGSLILESPAGMFRNEEESRKFLQQFRDAHDGDENTGKTAMLREGIKANMVTMSGRDSQWIEQRIFQRQEIALRFGLEEILGDDASVSYNSLVEKHIAYSVNTLNRWLVLIEGALGRSLLTAKEWVSQSHYFKFNGSALMRMDPSKQAEYLTKLIASRVMSPNEAREKLDMNPYDGGDTYENPAITVQRQQNADTEEPVIDEPDAAQRAAVVSRLRHMIGIEQQRITSAAKTKNVIAAIERFYAKWQDSLAKVCEELGGEPAMAAEHCRQSQDALIELLASADKAAAKDAIGELVAAWPERAESLADQILGAVHV